MKKICVPLANGFEEVEAITIIDICRRAEIEVTIAGVEGLNISGSHNIIVTADIEIQNINPNEFDMVVLPGGLPGAETLANNPIVQKILKEQKSKNGLIGAICAAPYALHKAGVLDGEYTCYPSWENKINPDNYQSVENIVKDGNIITSKGVGTSLCFALELVKILKGPKVHRDISNAVLANC
jgi:4-methyl-5(b-hydroxyethyl)-thiazole monophosphate biosynthesis